MHNTKSFNTVTASFYIIVKTGQTSDSLYSSFQGYYIDSFPGRRRNGLATWNGCYCDSSVHYAIGFYCCHVTKF